MQEKRYASPDNKLHYFKDTLEVNSASRYSPRRSPDKSFNQSQMSQRTGSPVRSRLGMDAVERAEYEEFAKEDYQRQIDSLKQQEGITEADIEQFQRSAIIQKSIDVVKLRADEQAAKRNSPGRYNNVKSKVARCLKVQKKTLKKNKQKKNAQMQQEIIDAADNVTDISRNNNTSSKSKTLNTELSVEQYGMKYGQQNSPWQKKTSEKLKVREDELKYKQDEFEKLKEEIKQKKFVVKEKVVIGSSKVKNADQITVERSESADAKKQESIVQKQIEVQESKVRNKSSMGHEAPQRRISDNDQGQQKISPDSNKYKRDGQTNEGEQQRQSQANNQVQNFQVKAKIEGAQSPPGMAPTKTVIVKKSQQQKKVNAGFNPDSLPKKEAAVVNNKSPISNKEVKALPKQQEDPESFAAIANGQVQKFHNEKKFHNQDLEDKTAAIQDEFEKLLNEMHANRKGRDADGFYEIIDQFNARGPDDDKKHLSPTKRLITMKNSTTEHKKVMKDNFQRTDYSLTYCSSPGKSYIIEPHGGELNYNLAQKNPLKFYDQVFNQDITQHKVKEEPLQKKKTNVEVSSKVTKRPYLRIMEKIKQKIILKLQEKMGEEFGMNIMNALRDQGIEQQIKILIKQDKIQLVNDHNEPIYQEQITKVANIDDQSSIHQEDSDDEVEQNNFEYECDDEDVSPDIKQSKTQLKMKDNDLQVIEQEVRDHIRRNSHRDI